MNSRLLTQAEKDANRRGRDHRNAQRQARRRRERLLDDLAALDGTGLQAELLSPRENLELLTGHLARAKAITARMARAIRATRIQHLGEAPVAVRDAPVRPSRVLREPNRGKVWPGLLAHALEAETAVPFADALAAAKLHGEQGATPHTLLDFFARASGLQWETAAQILHARRLIPAVFSPAEVRAIRRAREFWDQYRDGRDAWVAAVSAGEIPAMHGHWAVFESAQLAALLPGVHVPRLCRRSAYLANLVRDRSGLVLDLHAFPSVLPLFRHPI